jgi:surfactin synthase thioesterase subunit
VELECELINHGALQGGVHIDILRASLPIIRADYKGLETYIVSTESCEDPQEMDKFKGGVSVWGGTRDLDNVSEASLLGWKEHVADEELFSFRLFRGSHFYFTEDNTKEEFMDTLGKLCLASSTAVTSVHDE